MKDEYGSQRAYKDSERKEKRWDKVDLPFYGDVSLGNGSQYRISIFNIPDKTGIVFGIENKGCYTFSRYVHWTYAHEKLNLHKEDAKNIADFINAQLDVVSDDQGVYLDKYCYIANDQTNIHRRWPLRTT